MMTQNQASGNTMSQNKGIANNQKFKRSKKCEVISEPKFYDQNLESECRPVNFHQIWIAPFSFGSCGGPRGHMIHDK